MSQQRLSKLPTENVRIVEFFHKYDDKSVIGLVTTNDVKTYEPSHAIVIGHADLSEGWKAWYRADSRLPEHHGLGKVILTISEETSFAS